MKREEFKFVDGNFRMARILKKLDEKGRIRVSYTYRNNNHRGFVNLNGIVKCAKKESGYPDPFDWQDALQRSEG